MDIDSLIGLIVGNADVNSAGCLIAWQTSDGVTLEIFFSLRRAHANGAGPVPSCRLT